MSNNYFVEPSEGELILAHHGILGQKWGIRKYQNPDGTLTEAGKRRYGTVQNFNKIQNARVDAEAYKIRAKAEAKVARKQQKIDDKRNAKLEKEKQKEEDKRNLKIAKQMNKIQNKQAKKQAKLEEKYAIKAYKDQLKNAPKQKKNSKLKALVGDVGRDVVLPVAKNAARNMLSNYVDKKVSEIGMSPSDKQYAQYMKSTQKKLERINLTNAFYQANVDNAYLEKSMTGSYRQKSSLDFKNDWQNERGGTLYQPYYKKNKD